MVIKRRTWLQDAARVYKGFVDGTIVGSIGPMSTKSFQMSPGKHVVRLTMPTTGRSSVDDIDLDVAAGKRWVVRTVRRGGLLSFVKLPLATPEGVRALAENRAINSRFYGGPWIHVRVEKLQRDVGH